MFFLMLPEKILTNITDIHFLIQWKKPHLTETFTDHTLSILFSMKSNKIWIALIFIPLYFISVSSWDDGLIRTSKQETGILLKRLIALLKQIVRICYLFERKKQRQHNLPYCLFDCNNNNKRPCNWSNALFSILCILKKVAHIMPEC